MMKICVGGCRRGRRSGMAAAAVAAAGAAAARAAVAAAARAVEAAGNAADAVMGAETVGILHVVCWTGRWRSFTGENLNSLVDLCLFFNEEGKINALAAEVEKAVGGAKTVAANSEQQLRSMHEGNPC